MIRTSPARGRHHARRVLTAWSVRGVLVGVALSLLALPSRAATTIGNEHDVKAAFVLNFVRFTEWPAGALGAANAPLSVVVLGNSPVFVALQKAVDKPIKGRPVVVRQVTDLADLGTCHVLFIAESAHGLTTPALRAVGPTGVLTVSEVNEREPQDTVINLFIEDNRVGFDVNRDTAARSNVELSSRLLGVARRLHGRQQGKP